VSRYPSLNTRPNPTIRTIGFCSQRPAGLSSMHGSRGINSMPGTRRAVSATQGTNGSSPTILCGILPDNRSHADKSVCRPSSLSNRRKKGASSPPEVLEKEIDGLKRIIEDLIGHDVVDFAYSFSMRRHFSKCLQNYCLDRGFHTIANGIPGLQHVLQCSQWINRPPRNLFADFCTTSKACV